MGILSDGFIKTDTTKMTKEEVIEKLKKALPEYKVYEAKILGKPICVEETASVGMFISIKPDGFKLLQDAPSPYVRILKAQLGLLGYMIAKFFVKQKGNYQQLEISVIKALESL